MAASEPKQSDPAAAVIKCKEGLKSTATWGEVCQSVDQFLSSQLSDGLQSFDNLDEAEKATLILKTSNELEKSGQLESLKAELRQSLKDNVLLGHQVQSNPRRIGQDDSEETSTAYRQLCGLCQYLLLKWPHLSRRLAQCVLCILPTQLRIVVWNYCLSLNTNSDEVGATKGAGHQGDTPNSPPPHQRCTQCLAASSLLSFMLNWEHTVKLMSFAVSSWMQQEGRVLEDYEVLLVIPFVWVNLKSFRGSSWEEIEGSNLHHFIVYMYIQFMKVRPWYIQDLSMPICHDMTTKLIGAVNNLLIAIDPELHSSLNSSLTSIVSSSVGNSPPQGDTFLKELRLLIHPLLKCSFVGVVPLETVCMLMDQHLLSILFPSYDPLPYFLTSMLLVARRDLLRCRNTSQVNTALTQVLSRLTPRLLLDKVKHHYGNLLKSHVNTSHKIADSSVESYQLRLQVHHLEEMLLMKNSLALQTQEAESPHPSPRPPPGSQQPSAHPSPRSPPSVQTRTSSMSHPIVYSTEPTVTRTSTRTQQPTHMHPPGGTASSRTNSRRVTADTVRTATDPSLETTLSRPPPTSPTQSGPPRSRHSSLHTRGLSSYGPVNSNPQEPVPNAVVTPPTDIAMVTLPGAVATPPLPPPHSPSVPPMEIPENFTSSHNNSLSRARIQDFWLHILTRFSDAADLLFKGTEEEAQELYSQVQQ